MHITNGDGVEYEVPEELLLPRFSGSADGKASTVTLHHDHYSRMRAVVAAARSRDPLLVHLALNHFDKWDPKLIFKPE
jgi:hypothetical protein